ncbi:MAG: FkbM family methyltransferase [Salibacteraceae bacterium]|jgi:FkbM family methyltransferase
MKKTKFVLFSIIGYLIRHVYRNKIKHGDHVIYTASDLVSNLTIALIYFNRYEKDEIQLCAKYLTSNIDIIELGTSIGVVASTLQQQVNFKTMICVEANPSLHKLLRKTFELNKFRNYDLIDAAISDSHQPVCFASRNSNELGKIVSHSEIKVNTKSLPQIVKENNIQDYCLICDIEGAECSFILGKGLEKCQLIIIELHSIEWNKKTYTPTELSLLIQDKGFDLLEKANSTFAFKRMAIAT